MGDTKKLPSWKTTDVVYCSECEALFLKARAKKQASIFSDEGEGFACPACGATLEDPTPSMVKT